MAILPSYTHLFAIRLQDQVDASRAFRGTSQEIELKLEIVPHHVDKLPIPADARTREQVTIYYDTYNQALAEHGYTLRVRSDGDKHVQTIKPITSSAGLISRPEFEHPVASTAPDLSRLAGTPVAAIPLGDLNPTIHSVVKRTSWVMEVGGSRIQADLDEGTMTSDGRSGRFDELELELICGEPISLFAAARNIADRVPVRIGVLSKAERGTRLASGAFKKITKAHPVQVDRSMSVAEAFEVIVHACLKHYRLNEQLVSARRKPEALHQARVAMRRLRSAFTLFKSAIGDVEYQFLREELRWFTSQLGDARNLDVFLERELADSRRTTMMEQRERAYDHVATVMDSQRARSLMLELVGWAAFGPWRSGKLARKRVEGYASKRLDRLWLSIAQVGERLADLDEETRHELRIQVKKMRYAVEFLRGLYPEAATDERRFTLAVENLQESLGKLNDLATAKTLVAASETDDSWLIGEPEGRVHLREAEHAFRTLASVGPFWRGKGAFSQNDQRRRFRETSLETG